ncbi:MAG: glutamate 5-kinase [Hyphomicrobiales bacterium]|nr:glutamate 5-kinase [Hyphomicrobiales bacterium]MCY4053905.1 glutamate 5-kinase [Hyphomicrobiales bacterium]
MSIKNARRLVVKLGSYLLVDPDSGRINESWLTSLAEDFARLRKRSQEVVIVSSGAVALGRSVLKLPANDLRLEESQAAAAAGQIELARAWSTALQPHDINVAQVLLTLGDTEERRRYLNARATLQALLRCRAMPLINENDTVSTQQIRYGDNDRLAARVASMIGADTLVLLSHVDGLYTKDPTSGEGELVKQVNVLTPEIENMASKGTSALGRGGMKTKLQAARIAMAAGCRMIIASGKVSSPLGRLESGAPSTSFAPLGTPITARKAWIAGSLDTRGSVSIDAGAVEALRHGKSLLPAGVRTVTGSFGRGDMILVESPSGEEIARGLAAYSHRDALLIMGRKSDEIPDILGYHGRDELIHRDDLALLGIEGD